MPPQTGVVVLGGISSTSAASLPPFGREEVMGCQLVVQKKRTDFRPLISGFKGRFSGCAVIE